MPDLGQSGARRRGRMLDGALVFFYHQFAPAPDAGYAVGNDGRLFRNGEPVANVLTVSYDRDALGWWIEYETWPGTPLYREETTYAV